MRFGTAKGCTKFFEFWYGKGLYNVIGASMRELEELLKKESGLKVA